MEKYLCGRKALAYWGQDEVCETLNLPDQPEYIIFTDQDKFRTLGLRWCQNVAAKRYTQNKVCTLPYLFLQYANELSLVQLIYLGLQMCSSPPGRVQLCNVRKLKSCALSLKGHRGRRKALQAVQYLQNHSASPMESRLYMLLCLPNSLGGCGFPKAILNHPVKVDSKQFYIDLYFPSASLGIEYDSYEYHSNAKAFSQDTLRDAKLRTAGYRLIHVKPGQLREIKAFQDLITIISRILAKQVYIRTSKFFEPFSEIFHNFKAPAHVPVRRSDFPYFGGAAQAYEKYLRALE